MVMTINQNKLLIIATLLMGMAITGQTLAAADPVKAGGIGGTGSPAMHGGIGGTGVRPDDAIASQTVAGKVLFVVGQVDAQNLGQTRLLSKGDPVRVGDKLVSGKNAALQLRMEDGGTIVLRPDSQLVIESFAYKGTQDGSEHIALDLLTGGFRAITGNIGKVHKENYGIRTPNATVGIRGTDHETVFVPRTPPGQTAVIEPGTYNHVISGETMLQSDQGKLLIKPNQTGFAALNGAGPIIIDKSLPIFGDPQTHSGEHEERHEDINHVEKDRKESTGLSDSSSDAEEHLTQTELLANSTVDLNTFETDSSPAVTGSAVVGANLSLQKVGSAQAGKAGEKLLMEYGAPSAYSNDYNGFNYVDHDSTRIKYSTGKVDGIDVNWGIYDGGITFDSAGNVIEVDFHPFAFANAGATSPAVMNSIGGTANFSNVVGSSTVTESGKLGSSNLTLSVAIDLTSATITNYTLGVTDVDSRSWTGALPIGTSVALSTFANGTPLAVTCTGCSGTPSGTAAGIVIGPNAGGLISSYVMSTTTGQAVAGAVVLSRP